MTEYEAKDVLNCIAKMYRSNAEFKLDFSDSNDDLELIKDLQVYALSEKGYDIWVDIAYMTIHSHIPRPQVISIGKPHTCKHALKELLWCLERRDVGFWCRFGNERKWIPVFKKGTTLDEMKLMLDFGIHS